MNKNTKMSRKSRKSRAMNKTRARTRARARARTRARARARTINRRGGNDNTYSEFSNAKEICLKDPECKKWVASSGCGSIPDQHERHACQAEAIKKYYLNKNKQPLPNYLNY